MQDDLIHKNPFQFELATVVVNDSVTRDAITRARERAFLKFIQEDKCYSKNYDGIFVLFNATKSHDRTRSGWLTQIRKVIAALSKS